ncbi:MAG: hypothetical protein A2Y10_18810 [Planctomycetes bacterium GWF2_41_51]|nr:MAG: hypothetical protein A2Y10_18810 [Planctomycetes bacterium GWF2_41_51]HBG27355.1 hypothetical protein [Phycisphaerales bacterium]
MPTVSVCIPTYNREHLLKETLDSVFAQTYKDFEVVIVDDGSTDGTKQMLEKSGYNVRYHWQENMGDAAARNKLIELAQGKYISFLDSDDILYPDALERMTAAIPGNGEDVIIYGPYTAIDESGRVLLRKKKKLYNGRITQHLFGNILIHSCGSLFPKRILEQAGGFDTAFAVCSDYDLWLRLSVKYDFIAIEQPVFKRRRHHGNISKPSFQNRNIEYKILERFYIEGGGKDLVPSEMAMKRLSKEQYRAARSAIIESKRKTALNYLEGSLEKHFYLKSFVWLMIAQLRLHPAILGKDCSDEQLEKQPFVRRKKSIEDLTVAIDFEPVFVNRFSGFYSFGTGLLEGFAAIEKKPRLLLFYSRRYISAARTLLGYELDGTSEQSVLAVKRRWLEKFWKYFDYPKLEYLSGQFDVYHCFHHLMPPTNNKPRLMTVHDLRRYKLQEIYTKSKLAPFEYAVKNADHFLAVSQSTKNDLCSIFNIEHEKVNVITLATNIKPFEYGEEQKNKIKKDLSAKLKQQIDDYFVVISSPDTRKNIHRTVEAFEIARKSMHENFKLIVLGQMPKRDKEFVKKLNLNYYRNVICAGSVNDLKPWLGCATGLIFASLYEGFGIPILEGFSCSTPIITSNISSMPEVAGEAALYVDPYSTESISQAIVKIANDEELRKNLVSLGKERVKLFTWKRTAEDIIKVYEKLAGI